MNHFVKLLCSIGLMSLLPACGNPATLLPSPSPSQLPPTNTITLPAPTTVLLPTRSPTGLPAMALPTLAPLQTNKTPVLTFLRMIDGTLGWAGEMGGHLLRTSTDGQFWQDVTPPYGSFPSGGGFFAQDANTAWVTPTVPDCSNQVDCPDRPTIAVVWHTADGGQSWKSSQLFAIDRDRDGKSVPVTSYLPIEMQFVDSSNAWLLVEVNSGINSEQPLLFHTTDEGATWTIVNDHSHDLRGCAVSGFAFTGPTTGWVGQNCLGPMPAQSTIADILAAGGWHLSKTTDAGLSWNEYSLLPVPDDLKRPELAGQSADCGETSVRPITAQTIGVDLSCQIYTDPQQDLNYYYLSSDNGQTWDSWLATGNESFVNATTGWRLLDPGGGQLKQFQRTTDAGASWATISKVAWPQAELDFIDGKTGWAVVGTGADQAFVRTMDGGKTWAKIEPKLVAEFDGKIGDLKMFPGGSGWVNYHNLDTWAHLHTVDGGQTWQIIAPMQFQGSSSFSLVVLNGQSAWAYDIDHRDRGLLHTTDGGQSWSLVVEPLPYFFYINSEPTFTSETEGWTITYDVGAGQAHLMLYATHDGGASWTKLALTGINGDLHDDGSITLCNICHDVFYYSPGRMLILHGNLATEQDGTVHTSISFDLGKHWVAQAAPVPSRKYQDWGVQPDSPVFLNNQDGFFVLGMMIIGPTEAEVADAIYATHDGGRHWAAVSQAFSGGLVNFVTTQVFYRTCDHALCITQDGGKTWLALSSQLDFYPEDTGPFVSSFLFIDPHNGWAIGEDGDRYMLWRTTDGGRTWNEMAPVLIQ
jgi:photosystem II stability/assembly factor-like uncharacterized protein